MAEISGQVCEIVIFDKVKKYTKEEIKKILDSKTMKDYSFIYHDKDTNDKGEHKDNHYHIMCQFNNPVPFASIAKWFGVEVQNVNKLKYRYKVAIGYLTHYKQSNKYQYSNSEVISKYGDYETIDVKSQSQELLYSYGRLEITKKQLFEQLNEIDFHKYHKLYLDMVEYRTMKVRDRNMEVIYITGDSGSGKTTLAKYFAFSCNYDYFVSGSGKDILDGYDKEECIILDDLRGDVFTKSELFKLLDNNTNSSVKSRFRNKDISNCKLLIITSIKKPQELYDWTTWGDNTNETFTQLSRRLNGSQYLLVSKIKGTISQWKLIDEKNVKYEGEAPFTMNDVFSALHIVKELNNSPYATLFNVALQKMHKENKESKK